MVLWANTRPAGWKRSLQCGLCFEHRNLQSFKASHVWCTSTMKTILKITQVLQPPLQNHFLHSQVHEAAKNLHHWRTDQEEYGMNLEKNLMRTIKRIARVLEIIHSTFNVRKKKYLSETFATMVCSLPNNVKLINVKLKRVKKVQFKFITASWEGVSTDDVRHYDTVQSAVLAYHSGSARQSKQHLQT